MFRLLGFFIGITILGIISYFANRVRKARMRNALGRDVKNSDVTSISAWMEVAENEERKQPLNK